MSKYLKNNRGFTLHTLKKVRGFTLIELLIVIGILAILATTVVMVINPAEMVKQSRDGNRMAELQSINKALLVYQSFGGSSSMGTSNIIYISLPDSDSQCGSYYGTLTATSSPWNYHCSPEADYRKTDGTGWIPVDLTSVESSSGALFASLPIDPNNTATDQHYYTYIPGSWALSTTLESTKYLAANATSDGGQSSTRFEVGNNLSLNSNLDCTGFTYGGQNYTTVLIGSQCWMAENLNYDNGCSSEIWENYVDVGWCGYYTGGPFTDEGLLYQWSAAMNDSTTAGAQGICPSGWHIPTDAEWRILIEGQATVGCESSIGWQCSPAGTELKSGGSTGFDGILAGQRKDDGAFNARLSNAYFWSSVESGSNAWRRYLNSGYDTVYRNAANKPYSYSVRCLKD
jgi:uncharacterized protein (TIGR02145 family)/prepilin-type N-terminal cleavage/methylation domain-containing protein